MGGNLLPRIQWWYFMWKACMPASYQSWWGMSLPSDPIIAGFLTYPLSCQRGQGTGCAWCPCFQWWIWLFQKGFFCFFVFLQARLDCKHCGKPVIDVRIGMQYFSEYSNVQQCPHCGNLDYHFVKPFSSFKVLEAYWQKLCFSNSYFMGISTLLPIFL